MKKYFNLNRKITVVDIGTTKICTIIAEILDDFSFNILSVGIAPSQGLSSGIIVDVSQASKSIKKSIEEASLMAQYNPEYVIIGISGSHINSVYSSGMVTTKKNIVTQDLIDDVILSSKSIPILEDQKILHAMPLHYKVDNGCLIKNPLGMHGMRLEVETHIIMGNINSVQNLILACNNIGYEVEDVVLEPIASSLAVLTEEEQDLGALIVDIGGGTSDVALCSKESIIFTEIIPIAGNMFTHDLCVCLQTHKKEAERLKKTYGIFDSEVCHDTIEIEDIDSVLKRSIQSSFINDVLASRAIELISLIKKATGKYYLNYQAPSGVILTGGGSLIKGLDKVFESILDVKTRVGYPLVKSDLFRELQHPSYSTSYGLLLYKIQQLKQYKDSQAILESKSVFDRMQQWINRFF